MLCKEVTHKQTKTQTHASPDKGIKATTSCFAGQIQRRGADEGILG